MKQKKFSIDSVALDLFNEINENELTKLETQIGLQKICILGNHEKYLDKMKEIAKKLCDEDYPATIIDKIPEHCLLSDFQKEALILNKSSLILIIDSSVGGVVSESTYLLQNKSFVEKSILLITEGIDEADFFCTKKHYVYYPNKIKYSEEKLVEISIKAIKQATHRLALYAVFGKTEEKEKNK
jgi:hypothetical protein